MLGVLLWMWAQNILLVGIILDMHLHGVTIYTAELMRPVAVVVYVSFVIKYFAMHQNMEPAQRGTTGWQKGTSQC